MIIRKNKNKTVALTVDIDGNNMKQSTLWKVDVGRYQEASKHLQVTGRISKCKAQSVF